MERGKRPNGIGMLGGNGQNRDIVLAENRQKIIRRSKFPQRRFNPDLPYRRCADENFVTSVVYHIPNGWR